MGSEANEKEQSRKWQLTINNPENHSLMHETIKELLEEFSLIYWCMADEIGEEETYHTHLFIQSKGGIRFRTIKRYFPSAHIENPKGTALENRNYIFKEGLKYNKDLDTGCYEYTDSSGKIHKGTHYDSTNEEYGEAPEEKRGKRNDLKELYEMIEAGKSTYEIIKENPKYMNRIEMIEKNRQLILEEKYGNEFREKDVTYIWGKTGTGKTRSVIDKYGYRNVFRITDYDHPFDGYKQQDVIVFEEFRSDMKFSYMLDCLDGHPCELKARYANKQACYSKIYIISNMDLRCQYTGIQKVDPLGWKAFLRRIKTVQVFDGNHVSIFETQEYIDSNWQFLFDEKTPFDKENNNA